MFKNLTMKVTNKVGRQVLVAQKNSPRLLVAAGVAGFVGTVVLSIRATTKLDEVLEQGQKDILEVENTTMETAEEEKKASLRVRVNVAYKVAKLYALPVGLGVLSIGALTGSHVIMSRRNAGLTAAYAAVDKAYKEFRERVVAEYGEEKEAELRYGLVDKEIAVETDTGTDVKTVKAVGPNGMSMYAKCFDEQSSNWNPQHSYNAMFLRSQQNYANDLLIGRGHVFLNEVYDMLGLERTKAGAVVGWVKGNGDSFIDFGVFKGDEYMGQMFVNGNEKSVWLDFNVDGVVYDLLED